MSAAASSHLAEASPPDAAATTQPARVAVLERTLASIAQRHPRAVLASSFGLEDMVLIDAIARGGLPIAVFTLDTGRLPGETHALIDRVRERYGLVVEVFHPDAGALDAYVAAHGQNGFYRSLEARTACCAVRKTAPLERALAGRDAWITGLRRAQSATRTTIEDTAFDTDHRMQKFNPLAAWSDDAVRAYIDAFAVPYNTLHDQGYPSIGCAPCTRAVLPGEDIRAGRWWWENAASRECGLHRKPLDVAVRTIPVAAAAEAH